MSLKIVRESLDAAIVDPRAEIFIGRVLSQSLITDADAPSQRVTAVTFEDGARNRWHSHTTEQVLVVTSGHGMIVTSDEERDIEAHDVVLIPAGTRHWHGARQGTSMTHLSILLPGRTEVEAT